MEWVIKSEGFGHAAWHRIRSYNADTFFTECGIAVGRLGLTEMHTLPQPPANGIVCGGLCRLGRVALHRCSSRRNV
jgi:hypothetical protein